MRELVGRSTAEEVRTERRAEVEEGATIAVESLPLPQEREAAKSPFIFYIGLLLTIFGIIAALIILALILRHEKKRGQ